MEKRGILTLIVRNYGGEEMGRVTTVVTADEATHLRPQLEYTAQDGKRYPAFLEFEIRVEDLYAFQSGESAEGSARVDVADGSAGPVLPYPPPDGHEECYRVGYCVWKPERG